MDRQADRRTSRDRPAPWPPDDESTTARAAPENHVSALHKNESSVKFAGDTLSVVFHWYNRHVQVSHCVRLAGTRFLWALTCCCKRHSIFIVHYVRKQDRMTLIAPRKRKMYTITNSESELGFISCWFWDEIDCIYHGVWDSNEMSIECKQADDWFTNYSGVRFHFRRDEKSASRIGSRVQVWLRWNFFIDGADSWVPSLLIKLDIALRRRDIRMYVCTCIRCCAWMILKLARLRFKYIFEWKIKLKDKNYVTIHLDNSQIILFLRQFTLKQL